MPLDPQTKSVLDILASMPSLDFSTLSAPGYRNAIAASAPAAPGDKVAWIAEMSIPSPVGTLRLKLYYPSETKSLPVTLYFHGGGFVSCSTDTHDNICRCLAHRGQTLVASVDYRLAPEAKFPAAVEDAVAALEWIRAHAHEIGGDPERIAVAGDSAGATLATVTAQLSRQHKALRHQLLIYPVTDCRFDTGSYQAFAEGYLLSTEMMRWFWNHYLPDEQAANDPRACPLRQTKLSGLAPATIITAEFDPLRDEGEAYAAALRRADVPTTLHRWAGQIHGFASMLGAIDAADEVMTLAGKTLRNAFQN